jgi:CRP/FNR family transcriptional regulator, cyclic AMP receptor protein
MIEGEPQPVPGLSSLGGRYLGERFIPAAIDDDGEWGRDELEDVWLRVFLRRIILSQPDVERRSMSQEHYLDRPTLLPAGLDTKVALQPGETLFREGDSGDTLYIVSSGTVRILHGNVVYEDVQAGGILGEMAIVDEGMPRSASAVAMTHVELIEVDTSQFVTLIMSAPDFALRVMRLMARRLRRMNERASS